MKSYTLICNYCNHSWKMWELRRDVTYRCPICNDKDLKAIESVDAYGYDSQEPKEDAYVRRNK